MYLIVTCFIVFHRQMPLKRIFRMACEGPKPSKRGILCLCYAIPLEKLNKTKHGNIIDLWFERNMFNKATLPETNKAAENGWLEVERRSFPFWMACFQVLTVSFRKGTSQVCELLVCEQLRAYGYPSSFRDLRNSNFSLPKSQHFLDVFQIFQTVKKYTSTMMHLGN